MGRNMKAAMRSLEIELDSGSPGDMGDAPVVLAVDPGGITGWSLMQCHPEALVNPQTPVLANIEYWEHGQILSPANNSAEYACVDELVEIVRAWPGCCVVMEDFILRLLQKDRELLAPVRLNAVLGYALREKLNMDVTHLQQVGDAKTTCTDERLKSWGFYRSEGGMEHARDADRHALLWFRKAKDALQGARRRALWWPHIYGPGAPYYVEPPTQQERNELRHAGVAPDDNLAGETRDEAKGVGDLLRETEEIARDKGEDLKPNFQVASPTVAARASKVRGGASVAGTGRKGHGTPTRARAAGRAYRKGK